MTNSITPPRGGVFSNFPWGGVSLPLGGYLSPPGGVLEKSLRTTVRTPLFNSVRQTLGRYEGTQRELDRIYRIRSLQVEGQ
jgi:hypothetical protein